MKQNLLFLKIMAVGVMLLMGVNAGAATYFVKTNGSSAWANVPSGGTLYELTSTNIFAFDGSHLATDTYYFAPGTYNINATLALTTGKIYGGFSGNETSVTDLTTRVTSDLDGNGIVEPWEFSNGVTFTTSTTANNYGGASGYAGRLITVQGGEINGITVTDMYCKQSSGSGVIVLGQVTSSPSDNSVSLAGQLNNCIVRKNKMGAVATSGNGIVMSTNSASVINQCLIEDNNVQQEVELYI